MVFVGSILTASNFLKEHSSDITLMTPYSEGIHLAHLFRTQKTHKDAHEKEMGFCLTHYLCSIFNNYLVNKGQSIPDTVQKQLIDPSSTLSVKTIPTSFRLLRFSGKYILFKPIYAVTCKSAHLRWDFLQQRVSRVCQSGNATGGPIRAPRLLHYRGFSHLFSCLLEFLDHPWWS